MSATPKPIKVSRAAIERAAKFVAIQEAMIDKMDGEFWDSDSIAQEVKDFQEFVHVIRAVHTMSKTIEIEVTA